MPPARPTRLRWLLAPLVLAGAAAVFAFGPGEAAVVARSGEWRAAARQNLPAAVGLFVLAEVVLVGLSVPVGFMFTVLAGFLFGAALGAAVAGVASTAGAVLAFLSSRTVLAGPLRRAAGRRPRLRAALARIDRGVAAHGAFAVVVLRMTPVVPAWLVTLGLGLTPIRLRAFAGASFVGMLPMTAVVAAAGAELAAITSFRGVLSARVLVALALLPLVPLLGRLCLTGWAGASGRRQPAGGRVSDPQRPPAG